MANSCPDFTEMLVGEEAGGEEDVVGPLVIAEGAEGLGGEQSVACEVEVVGKCFYEPGRVGLIRGADEGVMDVLVVTVDGVKKSS